MRFPLSPTWHGLAAAVCILLPGLALGQARLKQVTEDQTYNSATGTASRVIAAQALPGPDRPLAVSGNFTGAVDFPIPLSDWQRGWNGALTGIAGVGSVFHGILQQDSACGPSPAFATTFYPADNDYAISLTSTATVAPAKRIPFDPDNDGDTDLAIVNHVASGTALPGITVHYNDGTGDFSTTRFFDWGNHESGLLIAAGDVNGDNRPDLLATTDSANVKVFFNDGQGGYTFAADYAVGRNALALADFDGDGDLDLATRGINPIVGTSRIQTLLNRGNGIFDPGPNTGTGESGRSIAAADFDDDGDADLALDHGDLVRVLFNQGNATFPTLLDLPAGTGSTVSVLARDATGDGVPDLFAAKGNAVEVLLNSGPGTFQDAVSYPGGSFTWMDLADLDGDGHLDLAATGSAGGGLRLTLLRNTGDGTFGGSQGVNIGFLDSPPSLATGDFDGNGIDDLASVYVSGGSFPQLNVLISTPAPQAAADCLRWTAGATPAHFDFLVPRWEGFFTFLPDPQSEMHDMAVDGNDAYLISSVNQTTYLQTTGETRFYLAPINSLANARDYLATAVDGKFIDALLIDVNLRPTAIANQNAPSRLILAGQQRDAGSAEFRGPDALLQRYAIPATSTPIDTLDHFGEPKLESMKVKDVAVTTDDEPWLGSEVAGQAIEGVPPTGPTLGGLTDLWVGQVDFAAQEVLNDFVLGSEGFDQWGAMAAGNNGEIYVAFNVNGRDITFGAKTFDLDDPSVAASTALHAFVGLIKSDGTPAWVAPLGIARSDSAAMAATGIAIDAAGNAYVSFTANGNFQVRNDFENFASTGQMLIDGTGRVVSWTKTPGVVAALTTAAFDVENRLNLGFTAPPFIEGKASFASIESDPIVQTSYTVCWTNPGGQNDSTALDAVISEVGGQVYLISNYPALNQTCISAYLTEAQFNELNDPIVLQIETDPLIIAPDQGDPVAFQNISNAGWALARLLDPFSFDAGPNAPFLFPAGFVTSTSAAKQVQVYVIDKGLASDQQFSFPDFGPADALPISFDGENGLCVDALAHQSDNGELDPDTASDHPKQAVNLVGVAGLGSAQGTAMEFISVDMYTGASTESGNCLTYLSYVSHGILQATSNAIQRAEERIALGLPVRPSIIVIASSGREPETRIGIDNAIQQALSANIPVIISAGNDGADVSEYLPARLGELDGVITVGGIAEGNATTPNPLYPDTNRDLSPTRKYISLHAPGEAVPTGLGVSSGTSFSCALVAGLAATYLSMNPEASPAEVEQALVDFSYKDPSGIKVAQSTCALPAWLVQHGLADSVNSPGFGLALDSDNDGLDNFGELLGGSDPSDPFDTARIRGGIDLQAQDVVASAWLPRQFLGPDGTLGDGCLQIPFEVQVSEDLDAWTPLDLGLGELTVGSVQGSRRELRFKIDRSRLNPSRAFLRFAFGPLDP